MATLALKQTTPSLGDIPTVTSTHSVCAMPSSATGNKALPPGASLYHTCRLVLDKLSLVDGMSYWLDLEDYDLSPSPSPVSGSTPPLIPISTSPSISAVNTNSDPGTPCSSNDPLSNLCQLCRRGTPLFTLYNALNTKQPLKMDPNPKLNQINNCKANVYHFLVACRQQLLFPEEELFTVSDLYVDDTNGFVKVVNTVYKLLQLLEDKGLISTPCTSRDSCPMATPKGIRDQVVFELLSTERKYVQDLETLQTYMRELQQQRILSQDTVHYLFGNLNALVDFQRRFLIQLEKVVENEPQEQHFGLLFIQMEGAFSVYEPYCSNFYSAQDLVVQEAPQLQKLNIVNPTHQLTSLLIKPIQRICKYPLLLNELIKATNKDWPSAAEMTNGLDAMRRVADKVNETQRKHENSQMVMELKQRVDNWKGVSIDKCGYLLLQDKLSVATNGNERELHVFFFENRLLLCKELKENNKNRLTKTNTISLKKRRRGTLTPVGSIETSMIISLKDMSSEGEWALTVEWKDYDMRQFTLKFRNEEQYNLWQATLNKQKGFKKRPSLPPSSGNLGITSPVVSPLSLPQATNGGNWSFIDADDEEDEVDFIDDSFDDSGPVTQSRSNSFSAHILSNLPTRARSGRKNSTDVSTNTGRSNTPGLNLQPLPRNTTGSTSIQQPSNVQLSGEYLFYPSSPPPSNPSSPTTLSRVSPNNSATGRPFRDPSSSQQLHHLLQQQQQHGITTNLSTPHEPMMPSVDYFAVTSSLTNGSSDASHSDKQQYQKMTSTLPHARSRAKSTPDIERNQQQQYQQQQQQQHHHHHHHRQQRSNRIGSVPTSTMREQHHYPVPPHTAALRLSDKKARHLYSHKWIVPLQQQQW
ncbi:unnamed protein product [Absidia cylindrospora]